MARVDGADDPMPEGLWHAAYRRALTSKRGQQVLRDLEQALLAIPDRRLAYEHISHDGAVCAVGAYVTWKELQASPSKDRAAIVKELEDAYYWEGESLRQTASVGNEAGIAWTLAWEIGAANDYSFGRDHTPEQRWEKMLEWVRQQIIQPVASA